MAERAPPVRPEFLALDARRRQTTLVPRSALRLAYQSGASEYFSPRLCVCVWTVRESKREPPRREHPGSLITRRRDDDRTERTDSTATSANRITRRRVSYLYYSPPSVGVIAYVFYVPFLHRPIRRYQTTGREPNTVTGPPSKPSSATAPTRYSR